MTATLTGISSMATRQLLTELAKAFEQQSSYRVSVESVGGVDAARRVAAGEAFDFVVLAADAIAKLGDADEVLQLLEIHGDEYLIGNYAEAL